MSDWQRLGVLISVLWLVGMPIYLMVDTNNTAGVVYQSCIRSADLAFEAGGFEGDKPGEVKGGGQGGAPTFFNKTILPRKPVGVALVVGGGGTPTLWD